MNIETAYIILKKCIAKVLDFMVEINTTQYKYAKYEGKYGGGMLSMRIISKIAASSNIHLKD